MTDSRRLLAEYARNGSEAAFSELVTRYVDLVYSVAVRSVGGDVHRAEDVAQTVFVDLARMARTLSGEVMVGGWLHRHTCFVAASTLRAERRRQARERRAAEMNTLQDHSEANLAQIGPILDSAINELGETDRTAIVLRFFEQRDFRSVGEALGSNEDAARMRVTRALEKLQGLLKRHGISTSAAALSVVLSASAIQAAPVGLATTITAAATLVGTSVAATATAVNVTQTIVMTTLQKILIAATFAVTAGTGIYEAHQASHLGDQVGTLQQKQASLAGQVIALQRERDEATNNLGLLRAELRQAQAGQDTSELLRLRGKVAGLQGTLNDPSEAEARELVARVNKLKQKLEETPAAKIPELALLEEKDWLAASRDWKLETEADFRKAFSGLRSTAQQAFANRAQAALEKFAQANERRFPTELSQLQPYFEPPVDSAILQGWEILPEGATLPGVGNSGPFITQKAAVDPLLDRRFAIGLSGYSCTDFLNSETQAFLMPVYKAFGTANNGAHGDDPSQLLPFATTPEQRAAVQRLIEQSAARK